MVKSLWKISWLFLLKLKSALAGVAQWIESGLRTKGPPDPFPVRAHAWVVAGSPVGGVQEATAH